MFNATLRDGRTYPQEQELDEATFAAYYPAADLFVGVWVARDESVTEAESRELPPDTTLTSLVAGRPWAEAVVGMYCASSSRTDSRLTSADVKPNYVRLCTHRTS